MSVNVIRILQIIPSAYQGSGILQVVLNWHRNIDRTKIQFDYLFSKPTTDNSARAEIESLGGRVYELPHPYQHPIKFLKETFLFFKNNKYYTLHSHMTNLNLFFYPLAKIFGTKNIIQHAHGTKWSDKKINGWRNYLMLHAVWPLITHKFACSQQAGEVFFGNNFKVIKNGVDLEKFTYNPEVRSAKRKELNLENNFVIGHIGRFSNEKNHKFLIDIFENIIRLEPSAKLVLVGSGPIQKEIREYVKRKKLEEKIIFLGVCKNVVELYSVLDVFCLPSLHEGMPLVALEAQCCGIPCLFSDTISEEVLVSPNSKMLSLKESPKIWADQILTLRNNKYKSSRQYLEKQGFNIKDIAKQIYDLYILLECIDEIR